MSDTNPSSTTEACWLVRGSLRKKVPLGIAGSGVNKSPLSTSEAGKEQARAVARGNRKGNEDAAIAGGFGGDAASPPRWEVGAEEGSGGIIEWGIFEGLRMLSQRIFAPLFQRGIYSNVTQWRRTSARGSVTCSL